MCLLSLATVTADGRPVVGPVDGIFYRGAFHFGSSPDSVRFRHIRKRPHVSAVHLPGEELAITVHARAVLVDVRAPENQEFRQTVLDIYVPRYGGQWADGIMDAGALGARIEADKIFTFARPGACSARRADRHGTPAQPSARRSAPGTPAGSTRAQPVMSPRPPRSAAGSAAPSA